MKFINALSLFLLSDLVMSAALPQVTTETTESTETLVPETADLNATFLGEILDHHEDISPNAITDSAGNLIELQWPKNNWHVGYLRTSFFLTMHSNGDTTIWTSVRNSNDFFPFKWSIACAVRDAQPNVPGHVYRFGAEGTVSARHTETRDTVTVNNADVAANWELIKAGDKVMHCVAAEGLDFPGTLQILVDLVKTYGPIIGDLIALF